MKISVVLCIAILAACARCHMPNVYEFCSHVLANERTEPRGSCDASTCQGRPGKRGLPGVPGLGSKGEPGVRGVAGVKGQPGVQGVAGVEGVQGVVGPKGEKGDPGTAEHLEERLASVEKALLLLRLLVGTVAEKVSMCEMGMRSGSIPDSAITASSVYLSIYAPYYGRLDRQYSGNDHGCWAAAYDRVGEWIQVDLGSPKPVAGVVTQGSPFVSGWVKSYAVACGNNTSSLPMITAGGSEKVFTANRDRDTKVIAKFPDVKMCRYVRVYPRTWKSYIYMRMELLKGECFNFI